MTDRFNDKRYGYITQNDLLAINAALREGADVRIKTIPNGVKILKEKPEVLKTKAIQIHR